MKGKITQHDINNCEKLIKYINKMNLSSNNSQNGGGNQKQIYRAKIDEYTAKLSRAGFDSVSMKNYLQTQLGRNNQLGGDPVEDLAKQFRDTEGALKDKKTAVQTSVDERLVEVRTRDDHIKELSKNYNELKRDYELKMKKLIGQKRLIKEKNDDIIKLTAEIAAIKATHSADADTKADSLEQLTKQLDEKVANVAELQARVESLEKQLAGVTAEFERVKEQLIVAEESLVEEKAKVTNCEKSSDDSLVKLKALDTEIRDLKVIPTYGPVPAEESFEYALDIMIKAIKEATVGDNDEIAENINEEVDRRKYTNEQIKDSLNRIFNNDESKVDPIINKIQNIIIPVAATPPAPPATP